MSVQSAVKQLADALADAHAGLEQAKQQVIHFDGQVIKIGEAYKALTAILPPEEFAAPAKKAGRKGAKAKAHKASDMPTTSADFWLGLITTTPQKTGEILAAAAAKLSITDDERIAVLKARMSSNLTNLIGEEKIKSEGERANRKYFV